MITRYKIQYDGVRYKIIQKVAKWSWLRKLTRKWEDYTLPDYDGYREVWYTRSLEIAQLKVHDLLECDKRNSIIRKRKWKTV